MNKIKKSLFGFLTYRKKYAHCVYFFPEDMAEFNETNEKSESEFSEFSEIPVKTHPHTRIKEKKTYIMLRQTL